MEKIVEHPARAVQRSAEERDITLEVTPRRQNLLVDKGFDPALGARPLKRAIQRLLEDPFAEFILRGQLPAGSNVIVTRKDDALDFVPVPAGTPAPTVVPTPQS